MADPLAYFLSWRTYGTWLHGDPRGSVDKRANCPGTDFIPPNRRWQEWEARQMKESPLHLTPEDRVAVEQAIREHCGFKEWAIVQLYC